MTKPASLVTIRDIKVLNGGKTAIHAARKYPMMIIPPFRDVQCVMFACFALSGQRSSMLTANYFVLLTRSRLEYRRNRFTQPNEGSVSSV